MSFLSGIKNSNAGAPNGTATLDANTEVVQLPSGASGALLGSVLRQDGTWNLAREGLRWAVRSSGYVAVAGDGIIIDTTGAAATITLPITPTVKDSIGFIDSLGSWGTNNLTILRNGQTIMSSATDLIANLSNKNFTLVFTGTDWRIV